MCCGCCCRSSRRHRAGPLRRQAARTLAESCSSPFVYSLSIYSLSSFRGTSGAKCLTNVAERLVSMLNVSLCNVFLQRSGRLRRSASCDRRNESGRPLLQKFRWWNRCFLPRFINSAPFVVLGALKRCLCLDVRRGQLPSCTVRVNLSFIRYSIWMRRIPVFDGWISSISY